jgi:large subunit ribosomal protein L18e
MAKKIKEISKTKLERAMQRKINPELKELILKLKKKKEKEWLYLAYLLARAKRKNKGISINKINKFSKANDTVIVPGKVLSQGTMNHKITIAAFSFSKEAAEKLKKAGCEVKTIMALANKKVKFKIIM